jgi:hypothetical protein
MLEVYLVSSSVSYGNTRITVRGKIFVRIVQLSGFVGRSQGLGVLGLVGFSGRSFPLFAHPQVPLQDVTSRESLAASFADPVLDIIMRLKVI